MITADKDRLDIPFAHQYLSNDSCWVKNIPFSTVQKCIDGSGCFGLYVQDNKINSGKSKYQQTPVLILATGN